MLSTESRMRGDMQVRFGGRYGKTYCRKAVRRSVPSLQYDEAWYENLDDITRINIWNDSEGVYEEKSIGIDTLDGLIENEDVWEFGEDVFDTVNPSTNLPYGYKLKKEINHEYTIIEEAV